MGGVPFSMKETILLYDISKWTIKYRIPSMEAAKCLSKVLRRNAILNGENINDSFRSVNGVASRISLMLE